MDREVAILQVSEDCVNKRKDGILCGLLFPISILETPALAARHHVTSDSILAYCMCAWFSSFVTADMKTLQKTIKMMGRSVAVPALL